MPVNDPIVRRLRAKIGGYACRGNLEAAEETRRELEIHQLREHIARVVASAPPLTPEKAAKLRALFPLPKAPEAVRDEDG